MDSTLYDAAPLIQNNEISFTLDAGDRVRSPEDRRIWVDDWHLYTPQAADPTVIAGNIIENNTEFGSKMQGETEVRRLPTGADGTAIESNIIRNNSDAIGDGGAITLIHVDGTPVAGNLIYGNSAGGMEELIFALLATTGAHYSTRSSIIPSSANRQRCLRSFGFADLVLTVNLSQSALVNNIIVGIDSNPASCMRRRLQLPEPDPISYRSQRYLQLSRATLTVAPALTKPAAMGISRPIRNS